MWQFYHYQLEVTSRVLFFFRDVYDPGDPRFAKAKFVVPPQVLGFLDSVASVASNYGVHIPPRSRFIRHPPPLIMRKMYTVDWSPPMEYDIATVELPDGPAPFQSWSEPLYNVHLPPASLVRLQRELVLAAQEAKAAGTPTPLPGGRRRSGSTAHIVWLSRRDTAFRHVVGEELIFAALRDEFGADALTVFGVDSSDRAAFRDADVIAGPHGAAFCNAIFAPPHVGLAILPVCDAAGCPGAQDVYMTYIGAALGLDYTLVTDGPLTPSVYRNYTLTTADTAQIQAVVSAVKGLVKAGEAKKVGR